MKMEKSKKLQQKDFSKCMLYLVVLHVLCCSVFNFVWPFCHGALKFDITRCLLQFSLNISSICNFNIHCPTLVSVNIY